MKLNKKENQVGIPTATDIKDIILYVVEKNGIETEQISAEEIQKIINEYNNLCSSFKANYVIGELDTFKRAACLLVAINTCGLKNISKDSLVDISIDASLKMSEKLYWFVGTFHNIPRKINEVNFEKLFDQNPYLLHGKEMLKDSVKYDATNYVSFADTLQLWHYLASTQCGIKPGIDANVDALSNPHTNVISEPATSDKTSEYNNQQTMAEDFRKNNLKGTFLSRTLARRKTRRDGRINRTNYGNA